MFLKIKTIRIFVWLENRNFLTKIYKLLLTQFLKTTAVLLLIVVFFSVPAKADILINTQTAKNAILYTKIKSFSDNDLTIDLLLNPNGQAVNMIGIYLEYSTTTLSLIDNDIANSFCTFTAENTHYEQQGGFLLICGLPNPGTSSEAIVTSLNFKRIASGTIEVSPQGESMVLANNGLGTNILSETIGTQIIFP